MGPLLQIGTYVFSTNSSGAATASLLGSGSSYVVPPGTAALSPSVTLAGCITVQVSSNSTLVDSFITTRSSLQSALTEVGVFGGPYFAACCLVGTSDQVLATIYIT